MLIHCTFSLLRRDWYLPYQLPSFWNLLVIFWSSVCTHVRGWFWIWSSSWVHCRGTAYPWTDSTRLRYIALRSWRSLTEGSRSPTPACHAATDSLTSHLSSTRSLPSWFVLQLLALQLFRLKEVKRRRKRRGIRMESPSKNRSGHKRCASPECTLKFNDNR